MAVPHLRAGKPIALMKTIIKYSNNRWNIQNYLMKHGDSMSELQITYWKPANAHKAAMRANESEKTMNWAGKYKFIWKCLEKKQNRVHAIQFNYCVKIHLFIRFFSLANRMLSITLDTECGLRLLFLENMLWNSFDRKYRKVHHSTSKQNGSKSEWNAVVFTSLKLTFTLLQTSSVHDTYMSSYHSLSQLHSLDIDCEL